MSHLDYFAIQPFLEWLYCQTREADSNYSDITNSTPSYWLGKWAAFEAVREFIEKGTED